MRGIDIREKIPPPPPPQLLIIEYRPTKTHTGPNTDKCINEPKLLKKNSQP